MLETYLKEQGQQLPSPGLTEQESGNQDEDIDDQEIGGVTTTMLHLHVSSAIGVE